MTAGRHVAEIIDQHTWNRGYRDNRSLDLYRTYGEHWRFTLAVGSEVEPTPPELEVVELTRWQVFRAGLRLCWLALSVK